MAVPCVVMAVWILVNPRATPLAAAGVIQAGHVDLACVDCHENSDGTLRQQIQANVKYALGYRHAPVDFGAAPIVSDICMDCHDRPNERHPIYRFNEPRFQDVLDNLAANSCMGCHTEHTDERSFAPIAICAQCHDAIDLKNDPIDISHKQLAGEKRWETCLGCHDFHGNHTRETQVVVADAYDVETIRAYLKNGASPYGDRKTYEGKKP